MIQRLLRGRLLYLLLGAFLAVFYASLWTRPWHPVPSAEVVSSSTTALPAPPIMAGEADRSLEWWPNELDLGTLRQMAVRRPLLAMLLWFLTTCAIGLALAGFVLSLRGLWSGRIRTLWHFTSSRLPPWSFGELSRITFLTLIMVGLLPLVHAASLPLGSGVMLDAHLRLTVSMLLLDGFAILTIVAFAQGKGTSVWRALGFSHQRLAASIGVGFHSYVAVFPWIFLLLFLVVAGAQAMGVRPPIEPIQELIFQDDRPVVLGLTALLACVVGPVAEELFFRGVVYTAIRRRTSWIIAMFASSALFALMHANLIGFPSLLMLGCLLGYLYERTGTLASSLAVHMAHNTFLVSIALVFREVMG